MKRSENPFFTPEQKALLEKTMEGAPEFEIERFLITCERTGLDPFSRQIYGNVQNKKVKTGKDSWGWVKTVVIITSIDGFRAIAERSGEYRGQTPPEWYCVGDDGKPGWHDVFIPKRDKMGNPLNIPEACRVGAIRKDFGAPCYGVANFDSFAVYQKGDDNAWYLSQFWKKMPEHMIAKVAEAQAIRKAFPLLACGLFVEEEVGKGDDEEQVIPARAGAAEEPLPEGMQWVPGHSPEDRAKAAAAAAAGAHAIVSGAPAAPAEAPAAPVTPPAAQAPAADPAPAAVTPKGRKPRAAAAPAETPAPAAPVAPAAETPAPVAPVETPTSAPVHVGAGAGHEGTAWADYKIEHITLAKFVGRKIGELDPADIKSLFEGWVQKYADKIKLNPGKVREAEMLTAAFQATHPTP